jgi:hypothetical protein
MVPKLSMAGSALIFADQAVVRSMYIQTSNVSISKITLYAKFLTVYINTIILTLGSQTKFSRRNETY